MSPPQQGPSGKKEDHDDVETPASGDESADVHTETSKGNQAPIVLTEEL
jgi:hypothetical protein